jgi:hypothetical protein
VELGRVSASLRFMFLLLLSNCPAVERVQCSIGADSSLPVNNEDVLYLFAIFLILFVSCIEKMVDIYGIFSETSTIPLLCIYRASHCL